MAGCWGKFLLCYGRVSVTNVTKAQTLNPRLSLYVINLIAYAVLTSQFTIPAYSMGIINQLLPLLDLLYTTAARDVWTSATPLMDMHISFRAMMLVLRKGYQDDEEKLEKGERRLLNAFWPAYENILLASLGQNREGDRGELVSVPTNLLLLWVELTKVI